MNTPMFRWGILGAAQIARKNWKAIGNTGNGVIAAVASRDPERSRRFIAECQANAPFAAPPRALGSYEELLAASDIDGVYIPLPTGLRKEWVLRAAGAGKHVVCEKPCAVTLADLAEMTEACRRNGVQFMDGVMFMHSARLARVRQALDDGHTIGPIRRIASAFSFKGTDEFFASNIRAHSRLEPHGCLGDLGWYCIRFVLWAMSWKLPRRVTGHILSAVHPKGEPAPVPTEFAGELFFADGVSSSFYCSFITELEQWVELGGTLGHLRIPDFVLPFSGSEIAFDTGSPRHNVHGCDFEMQPNVRRWTVSEHSHSHASAQETQLFRDFACQAQSGGLDEAWPALALKTQQVMQACRESAHAGGRIVELGNGEAGRARAKTSSEI